MRSVVNKTDKAFSGEIEGFRKMIGEDMICDSLPTIKNMINLCQTRKYIGFWLPEIYDIFNLHAIKQHGFDASFFLDKWPHISNYKDKFSEVAYQLTLAQPEKAAKIHAYASRIAKDVISLNFPKNNRTLETFNNRTVYMTVEPNYKLYIREYPSISFRDYIQGIREKGGSGQEDEKFIEITLPRDFTSLPTTRSNPDKYYRDLLTAREINGIHFTHNITSKEAYALIEAGKELPKYPENRCENHIKKTGKRFGM